MIETTELNNEQLSAYNLGIMLARVLDSNVKIYAKKQLMFLYENMRNQGRMHDLTTEAILHYSEIRSQWDNHPELLTLIKSTDGNRALIALGWNHENNRLWNGNK